MLTLSWLHFIYVLFPVLSGLLAIFVMVFAWQRRKTRWAGTFILFSLTVAIWSWGYAFELLAMTLAAKKFWVVFQYVGITMLPPAWVVFALQHTGRERQITPLAIYGLLIIPIISNIMLWTNSFHHLFYTSTELTLDTPIPFYIAQYGPWFYIHSGYSYILIILPMILFGVRAVRASGLYRWQNAIFLIGSLMPLAANFLYLTGHVPVPGLDITVASLAVSAALVAWGLFGLRLMDVMPAARDVVLENMSDAVLVIDDQHRIIDANQAAAKIMGQSIGEMFGQSILILPVEKPEMFDRFMHIQDGRIFITLSVDGQPRYYDMRISPLIDRRGHLNARILTLNDVTPSQYMAEVLARNESRLRALFDAIGDVVIVINREDYITEVHYPSREIEIIPPEQLLARRYQEAMPVEAAEAYSNAMEQVEKTGQVQLVDFHYQVGGTAIWYSSTVSAVRDEMGEITSFMIVARDITERKGAENAVRQSEERLDLALRGADLGLWDWHIPSGTVVYDERWTGMLGYQLNEIDQTNEALEMLMHPDDLRSTRRAVQAHFVGETESYEAEYRLQSRRGAWRWILTRGRVMARDEDGSPIRMTGTHLDITERKQADEALRESEAKFRQLFESAFEAIALIDAGEIVDVNAAFVTLFGYRLERLQGMPVVVLASDGDRGQITRQTLGDDDNVHELTMVRNNGTLFAAEVRAQTLSIQEDSYRVLTIRDLSERQQLEVAEREQRIMAEVMRDTAAALSSTLDLNDVLDHILDSVGRIVPHDAVNIMLLEGDHARIVRARGYEQYGISEPEVTLRMSTTLDTLNFQQMTRSGRPLAIPDVTRYPGWNKQKETAWVRSYAGAPINVDDELVGFLNLDSAIPGFYTIDHAERLQTFANQAATALRNAQLFAETQDHNQKLALLNAITKIGTATLDLDELLDSLVEETAGIIGADDCYITLWDETQQRIIQGAASGELHEMYQNIAQIPQPGEVTLTESVLGIGHSLAIEDVRQSPYTSPRIAAMFPNESVLALPLRVAQRKLGALLLAFHEPHHFTLEEIVWAGQAAELIALAISRSQSYGQLQDRNEELDAFGHTVAHDLKGPLHGILNDIEIFRMEYGDDLNADAHELLSDALNFTDKMDEIIDSLLMLATVRRTELKLNSVDVDWVVKSALRRVRHQVKERKVTINVAEELHYVQAYSTWLEEVFVNLISNAIKYVGEDNPDPIIEITCEHDGKAIRYLVHDNGVGLTNDQQAHVFDMLTRYHGRGISGSGLGLSIVQRIISRMNGTVGVESEIGVGSTFWFTLEASTSTVSK